MEDGIKEHYENTKRYWKDLLGNIKVETPMESMNILLNGWLLYQTMCSRMLAKSGYYQSGGAFGFRDQLQDCIGLKYVSADILKKQILEHSQHQFIEGDVEHWWHEETKRGIRTRFSDDLLWLPYLVAEYINFTGDYGILEEKTHYVKGAILENGVDERYDLYLPSDVCESIYMHCIRAIEKSFNFGENGLPKIGSGDWNDGFSTVGNKGKGESVWLGFFQYTVLDKFSKICEKYGDKLENKGIKNDEQKDMNKSKDENIENKGKIRADKFKNIMGNLRRALNTNGWDGRWYKRAFMDDGNALGTLQNEECKIDGISQSWATISNAGDNDKKYISMASLENHLVDKENGIIKLLDPPFEKSKLDPGYIKGYLPGTRENGGQYTHGAIWAIIAEAILGFGDKSLEFEKSKLDPGYIKGYLPGTRENGGQYTHGAIWAIIAEAILGFGDKSLDLFRMINPIEHSRTKESAKKYKVEPYVLAADIYGYGNLAGRGGWTWYTGSSSWLYEAGIHYILGLTIKEGYLYIEPCIPSSWKEYSIIYRYGSSIYHIKVQNKNEKTTGVEKILCNGIEVPEKRIKLIDDRKVYEIMVIM